jgi:hypothetical protein
MEENNQEGGFPPNGARNFQIAQEVRAMYLPALRVLAADARKLDSPEGSQAAVHEGAHAAQHQNHPDFFDEVAAAALDELRLRETFGPHAEETQRAQERVRVLKTLMESHAGWVERQLNLPGAYGDTRYSLYSAVGQLEAVQGGSVKPGNIDPLFSRPQLAEVLLGRSPSVQLELMPGESREALAESVEWLRSARKDPIAVELVQDGAVVGQL